MGARQVARVLIDSPVPQLDRLFDYEIPAELSSSAHPGVRVRVPLRSAGRLVEGYLIERGEDEASQRPLSEMAEVLSPVSVVPPTLYELVRRVADRAAGGAADILRLVVPKRMVRAEKTWLAAPEPVPPTVETEALERAGRILDGFDRLREMLGSNARMCLQAPPHTATAADGDPVGAWAMVLAAAATVTLAGGRSAVLVTPDHRDQDVLERALAGFLPAEALVRADARRSGPERYRSHLRMLAEAPCVVVGNRSAVYAPTSSTGLIAVWDDGDPLLSEPLTPYVHPRDVALVRQQLDGCALLLAAHTRSTDVQRLVQTGWLREVSAARRRSPRVVLSATREGEARGTRVPSSAFADARAGLTRGPVLVQVARPGYAPTLVCAGCRTPARCTTCGGPLTARSHGSVPVCGWCGRTAIGWRCASCEETSVRMASSGSERTADELGRAFPNTRVIVADGDHPVRSVSGEPALVVATRGAEPIAAGGYAAVLLLDGDRMLLSDDLRIGESCLRWWSNAAALAAAGAPVHLVGVVGPVARALATWNQPGYARSELAERAQLHMPPTVRVALVEGPGSQVREAISALHEAVDTLAADAVLGPVPVEEDATTQRALVRFPYAQGAAVAGALRAAVIAQALRTRRRGKAARGAAARRNTLRVHLDVLDPQL